MNHRSLCSKSPLMRHWILFGILPALLGAYPQHALGGGPIRLHFPEGRPDTFLTLYGPGNRTTVIVENDDVIPGAGASRIVHELEAGRDYFAKVSVFDNPGRDDTGPYLISVAGPGGETVTAPDASVVPLMVNASPTSADLSSESDEDWYVFRTAEEGMYTIDATFDPERGGIGVPVRWVELPIRYNVDIGPLGSLDAQSAADLVDQSIDVWNDVATSTARLERGPDLEFDFDLQTFGPAPRFLHQLFYDATREKVLLLGGTDPNNRQDFGDLWEWDGEEWSIISLASYPPARSAFAAAYDTSRAELVIFGGTVASGDLNETWIWNGQVWEEAFPEVSPSPRSTSAMAYDRGRDQVVLFGGVAADGIVGDTWIWENEGWAKAPVSGSPPPRAGHQLVFDPARGELLLFGGFNQQGNLNDLWKWAGDRWTKVAFNAGPVPRDSFTMAYDAKRQMVLLFGGFDENGRRLDDTWTWDGSEWTELSPANQPSPRQLHAMAFDEQRGEMILFGGEFAGPGSFNDEILGDTWVWNGSDWRSAADSMDVFALQQQLLSQGLNPVIFDVRGDLVDLMFGMGAKRNILGFAGPQIIVGDEIRAGWSVINGWSIDTGDESQMNEVKWTVSHEFGHFLGLGHAQFYGHMSLNSYEADDIYSPLMYWLQAPTAGFLPPSLHYDDAIALSRLYPSDERPLDVGLGAITGRAVFADGTPVLGSMVAARLVGDRYNTLVGTQTDTFEGVTGEFMLPGLPPGQYEVWIEPVNPSSSVSIHNFASKEFPVRPEYYNGDGEGDDASRDNPSLVTLVDVAAGEESVVDFICEPLVSERERSSQILAFDSPMLSGFGTRFRFGASTPFLVVVDEAIDDLTVSVDMEDTRAIILRIWLEDTIVFDSGTDPGGRVGAGMVYDRARGHTVLLGGFSGVRMSDLWAWDGQQWSFVVDNPHMPDREGLAMVYDEGEDRTIMFGGIDNGNQHLGDTWIWDGQDWSELAGDDAPSPRQGMAMAYDPGRGKTVLFGGADDNSLLGDTWELSGSQWSLIRVSGGPSARWFSAMVYDPGREAVLLFGGGVENGRANDTWEYDGLEWRQIETADAPDPRAGQAMVYDPQRQRTVLFGGRTEEGRLNDTWEYDGENWLRISTRTLPAGRSPSGQMVYDSARQRVVLFGGLSANSTTLADTWEYDGTNWQRFNSQVPDPSVARVATFTRSRENGSRRLESGSYYISVDNPGGASGPYNVIASSTSVGDETSVLSWELY